MVKWQLNICRRRTRSARYYQIFGPEPEYPCMIFCFQCIFGGFKCLIYCGLIYLLFKWYIWPIYAPSITKNALVQMTLNRSSSLLDRLRTNRNIHFG